MDYVRRVAPACTMSARDSILQLLLMSMGSARDTKGLSKKTSKPEMLEQGNSGGKG
jgi:hypothetical protein